MEKLEKQNNQNIPKLRFSDFSGEWEAKILKEIASKVTDKNRDDLINNVFTNSASRGIVNQKDYFDKDIANQNNLQNYYIVERGDFVYNPRISNHAPVGPISLNRLGRGIMSPLYSVFRIKYGNLEFIEKYFSTTKWHEYMKSIANYGARSDRMNIIAQDFYLMPIMFPTDKEQQKIANFLTLIDNRIEKLIDKKNLLENYKKGVMQQIFSQKIRFKDYDDNDYDDWKEEELGNILSYEQPTNYIVKNTDYDDSFKTPVLTAGKSFILGYTNEKHNIFEKKLPVIIFDDFTTANKFVDFPFKVKSSAMKILQAKEGVNIKFIFEAMQNLKYIVGGHERHWISKFSYIAIRVPQSEEQQKIANFLTTIDKKIENMQTKIEEVKNFKKGLLQKMFV